MASDGCPTDGMSPSQRTLRARLAAYAMHARHDGREITANARKAFVERFEREVDPDGVLPIGERQRRAEHAMRAHMTRLALRSAQARRRRATDSA
jgi:hypothetical protein